MDDFLDELLPDSPDSFDFTTEPLGDAARRAVLVTLMTAAGHPPRVLVEFDDEDSAHRFMILMLPFLRPVRPVGPAGD